MDPIEAEVVETQLEDTGDLEPTSIEVALGEVEAPEVQPGPVAQAVEEVEEVVEEAPAEAAAAQPDDGAELTEEQVEALPPAEQGQYKGMKAEREKRQKVETDLEASNAIIEDMKAQKVYSDALLKSLSSPHPATGAEEVKETPDFWADPKAAVNHEMSPLGEEVADLKRQVLASNLQMSEAMAKTAHADYAAVTAGIVEEALELHKQGDSAAISHILQSPNPGEAVYRIGSQRKTNAEINAVGGLDALVEQRVAAGLEAAAAEAAEQIDKVVFPKALGGKRSVSGLTATPVYKGPTEISDVVG